MFDENSRYGCLQPTVKRSPLSLLTASCLSCRSLFGRRPVGRKLPLPSITGFVGQKAAPPGPSSIGGCVQRVYGPGLYGLVFITSGGAKHCLLTPVCLFLLHPVRLRSLTRSRQRSLLAVFANSVAGVSVSCSTRLCPRSPIPLPKVIASQRSIPAQAPIQCRCRPKPLLAELLQSVCSLILFLP